MRRTAPHRAPVRRAPESVALDWRLIRDEPLAGARNMALDHAVASCVSVGAGVVRLYEWARTTVSFGKNEPVVGAYSNTALRDRGVDCVRRPTGGRAVLHADELTYAVAAPVRALGGLRVAYRRINEGLARAFESLGASVELSRGGSVLDLGAGPCFQSPAEGEVVAGGRKLVGSAQARIGGALLQHGSIILSGDQSLLAELSSDGRRHAAPATLDELVDRASVHDVADAVSNALRSSFGGSWSDGEYTAAEIGEADRLEAELYARETWTWRC